MKSKYELMSLEATISCNARTSTQCFTVNYNINLVLLTYRNFREKYEKNLAKHSHIVTLNSHFTIRVSRQYKIQETSNGKRP